MEYKVTVIVPVFKVEKYLRRCVDSLLAQTLSSLEIILVDDGSPDNSPFICDEYAAHYANVQVIHKENEGLGMACNTGLQKATGQYVAFLDSDDWVENTMYETLLKTAEDNCAQVVYSGYQYVTDQKDIIPFAQAKEFKKYASRNEIRQFMLGMIASEPSAKIERQVPMSAKVALYKRHFLKDYSLYFESERKLIAEDLFFNLDVLSNADCVVEIPKTFYNYFINTASLSNMYKEDRFDKAIIMRNELLVRYGEPTKEFRLRVDRMFIGFVRSAIRQICSVKGKTIKYKYNLIKKICDNSLWKEISDTYPVSVMPFQHRIYLIAIQKKWINLIYILTQLKRL